MRGWTENKRVTHWLDNNDESPIDSDGICGASGQKYNINGLLRIVAEEAVRDTLTEVMNFMNLGIDDSLSPSEAEEAIYKYVLSKMPSMHTPKLDQ